MDNYNIKVTGAGMAVLKITFYIETDTGSAENTVYFAVNGITIDAGFYDIYTAIENINSVILINGINNFEDADAVYTDYYKALTLINVSSTFNADIDIQHDGIFNIWNITNGYKFLEARNLLSNYFDLNRLLLTETLFISEYEGIVLRFGHEITENDILAYSFYREEEYKTEKNIYQIQELY